MLPRPQATLTSADRSWRGLALLAAGAFFMEMLDGTVIATAAPSMAASFGGRSFDINTTITIYLLTVAVFIPVSGWVADRFRQPDGICFLPVTATSASNVAFFLLGGIAWICVLESVQLAPHAGAGVSAATRRRVHGNANGLPDRFWRLPGATNWMSAKGKGNDMETEVDAASCPPSWIAGDSSRERQR